VGANVPYVDPCGTEGLFIYLYLCSFFTTTPSSISISLSFKYKVWYQVIRGGQIPKMLLSQLSLITIHNYCNKKQFYIYIVSNALPIKIFNRIFDLPASLPNTVKGLHTIRDVMIMEWDWIERNMLESILLYKFSV